MDNLLNIVVIGVGGGGGNMISHLVKNSYKEIKHIAANTDIQALRDKEPNIEILQLGKNIARGLGAGMNPEIGLESAKNSHKEIEEAIFSADMVFICAGMGGGTGTGAAPYIAEISKNLGILTVGVVTKPFKFEGKKRMKLAEAGIERMAEVCDSRIVIPNENLLGIIDRKTGFKNSFKIVDTILSEAVQGISGIILNNSAGDINLDFADIKTVMQHKGLSLMSIGISETSAAEAINNALTSPLLKNLSLNSAKGIIVHYSINPKYPLIDLTSSLDILEVVADEDAEIIFGTTSNSEFPLTYVKVTIIATGLGDKEDEIKVKESTLKMPTPKIRHVFEDSNSLDIPTYMRRAM